VKGLASVSSTLGGDERGDVLADESAAVGDFQGARQDAVHLDHVGGGVSLVEHDTVHALKVFWLEFVQAVLADAGDDVVEGLGPVVVQGARLELQARDVREVCGHPLFHRRLAAGLGGASLVPEGFQLADLALHFRLGLSIPSICGDLPMQPAPR